MDSISKDLRDSLLEVDVEEADEWPRLRNWAKDFRRKYKLTVSEFLRVMDSDKDSIYFAQLLSSSKRSPSKRSGYLSFQLREDLRNFRNKIDSEDDINAKDVLLEDRMEDLEDRIEDGLAEYELTQPMSFSINISKFREDVVEFSVSTVGKEDSILHLSTAFQQQMAPSVRRGLRTEFFSKSRDKLIFRQSGVGVGIIVTVIWHFSFVLGIA